MSSFLHRYTRSATMNIIRRDGIGSSVVSSGAKRRQQQYRHLVMLKSSFVTRSAVTTSDIVGIELRLLFVLLTIVVALNRPVSAHPSPVKQVLVQHTISSSGGGGSSAGGATELGEYCQLEMFRATCSDGHVVVMKSALYGRMRLGRCVQRDYGFIGCSNDVTAHVDRLCSGRQGCEFQVAELHKNQPCPTDLTPFLQASYECVPVVTANDQRCSPRRDPISVSVLSVPPVSTLEQTAVLPAEVDETSSATVVGPNGGYLASAVTLDAGRGGPDCPWRLRVSPGQRINITLIYFARVELPLPSTSGTGSSSSSSSSTSLLLQPPSPPVARPKICYQLANIRERQYTRVLTECEGSPRESHAFLSTSDTVEIDIIVAKVLKVYFLLHFHAVGCPNPSVGPGMYFRRDHTSSNTATVRCNTTYAPMSGSVTAEESSTTGSWRLTCVGTEWQWPHGGSAKYNCTPAQTGTSKSGSGIGNGYPSSAVRSSALPPSEGDLHQISTSWTVGQLFPFDSFPYSILIVVSIGVALGVFVGGVLLVGAARYFRRMNEEQAHDEYAAGAATSPTDVAVDYFRSLHPGQYSSTLAMNGGSGGGVGDTAGLLLVNGSNGKTHGSITTARTGGDVTTDVGSLCDVIDHVASSLRADNGRVPDVPVAGSRLMSTTHDAYYRCAPSYGRLPDTDSRHLSSTMTTSGGGDRWTTTRIDFAPYRDHLSNTVITS